MGVADPLRMEHAADHEPAHHFMGGKAPWSQSQVKRQAASDVGLAGSVLFGSSRDTTRR
jgi:hypothetical protein